MLTNLRNTPKMRQASKLQKPELNNLGLTARILALCEGEDDEIAIMATAVCQLCQEVDGFDWVGF